MKIYSIMIIILCSNEETQKALVRNIIDNKKKNGILERLQTVVQNLEDEKKSALERYLCILKKINKPLSLYIIPGMSASKALKGTNLHNKNTQ